jgi:D-alanine-D-alanine ligase
MSLLEKGRELARANRRTVRFVRADAREIGLASESFDRVLIMGNSLGYLPDPAGDLRILEEARRLLKPGARLLLDVADGAGASQRLSPNAWHEIGDDILVCREREIHGRRILTREVVLSKSRGMIRDRSYAVRVFEAEDLTRLLSQAKFREIGISRGFSPQRAAGDYGFMNSRILATARK